VSEYKHKYAIETFKEIIRGRKALLEEWRLSDIERAKIKINIKKLESAIKRLKGGKDNG